MELSTDQKGATAELAIAAAAAALGIGVLKPLTDGERYDLVFDLRSRLVRVQCKWATRYGDVIAVRCYRARRGLNGLINRGYSSKEIDAYAAYCADLGRCFFLPIELFGQQRQIQLRLRPTRNNQRLKIHWADDYDFDRLHWPSLGAVAQLGERVHGMHEAAGSSPAGSTDSAASAAADPYDATERPGPPLSAEPRADDRLDLDEPASPAAGLQLVRDVEAPLAREPPKDEHRLPRLPVRDTP
jgi:hypothetical protein